MLQDVESEHVLHMDGDRIFNNTSVNGFSGANNVIIDTYLHRWQCVVVMVDAQ